MATRTFLVGDRFEEPTTGKCFEIASIAVTVGPGFNVGVFTMRRINIRESFSITADEVADKLDASVWRKYNGE